MSDADNVVIDRRVLSIFVIGTAVVIVANVVALVITHINYLRIALQPVNIDVVDAYILVKPIAGGFNITAVAVVHNPNPFNITVSGMDADLGDVCGGGFLIFFHTYRCRTALYMPQEITIAPNTTKVIAVSITRNTAVTVTNITTISLYIYRSDIKPPTASRITHTVTAHAKIIGG